MKLIATTSTRTLATARFAADTIETLVAAGWQPQFRATGIRLTKAGQSWSLFALMAGECIRRIDVTGADFDCLPKFAEDKRPTNKVVCFIETQEQLTAALAEAGL